MFNYFETTTGPDGVDPSPALRKAAAQAFVRLVGQEALMGHVPQRLGKKDEAILAASWSCTESTRTAVKIRLRHRWKTLCFSARSNLGLGIAFSSFLGRHQRLIPVMPSTEFLLDCIQQRCSLWLRNSLRFAVPHASLHRWRYCNVFTCCERDKFAFRLDFTINF